MDKCKAFFKKAKWLDTPSSLSSNWQPRGCMLYNYQSNDIQSCLREQRVVFIGDSTTRQVFLALARKLNHEQAAEFDTGHRHEDIAISSCQVMLQFIWDPWLNSTRLQKELGLYDGDIRQISHQPPLMPSSAKLLVLGTPGLWYARFRAKNWFEDYKNTIDSVVSLPKSAASLKVRITPQNSSTVNMLVLLLIQVPLFSALSTSRAETMTPKSIDDMQSYLAGIFITTPAEALLQRKVSIPWSFVAMMKNTPKHIRSFGYISS
jgi:N-acetylneuraminate 9-O-acetyltransferase